MLRNYIFLHTIENELALPIGTQDAELLDPEVSDEDENALLPDAADDNGDGGETTLMAGMIVSPLRSEDEYRRRAAQVYEQYATQYRRRFKWLRPALFTANLKKDLLQDVRALLQVLSQCGTWNVAKDAKLAALVDLLTNRHPELLPRLKEMRHRLSHLSQHTTNRG